MSLYDEFEDIIDFSDGIIDVGPIRMKIYIAYREKLTEEEINDLEEKFANVFGLKKEDIDNSNSDGSKQIIRLRNLKDFNVYWPEEIRPSSVFDKIVFISFILEDRESLLLYPNESISVQKKQKGLFNSFFSEFNLTLISMDKLEKLLENPDFLGSIASYFFFNPCVEKETLNFIEEDQWKEELRKTNESCNKPLEILCLDINHHVEWLDISEFNNRIDDKAKKSNQEWITNYLSYEIITYPDRKTHTIHLMLRKNSKPDNIRSFNKNAITAYAYIED